MRSSLPREKVADLAGRLGERGVRPTSPSAAAGDADAGGGDCAGVSTQPASSTAQRRTVEAERSDPVGPRRLTARAAASARRCARRRGASRSRLRSFFFGPGERLLDAARMQPDAELGLDERHEPARPRSARAVPGGSARTEGSPG